MGGLILTVKTTRTARNVVSAAISALERPPRARGVDDYNGYRAENVSDGLVIKNVFVKTETTREVKRYRNSTSIGLIYKECCFTFRKSAILPSLPRMETPLSKSS